MIVSLTPSLDEYVRRIIAVGRYESPSDVVCEAREREAAVRRELKRDDVVVALKALEPELRQRGVISTALFGSFVHGLARPDSDVDVLIAVEAEAVFG
jgi:Arc/MetJ-type ribon-helix-helix transcriptional regulator